MELEHALVCDQRVPVKLAAELDPERRENDVVGVTDTDVRGLFVQGSAPLVERPEVVSVLSERPGRPCDPFPRLVDLDLDEDRQRVLPKGLANRRRLHRAAAESQHGGPVLTERFERPFGLDHPEACFSLLLEQLRNRTSERPLDLAVEVEEQPPGPGRDHGTDRRLPRAHEADERDVPV